MAFVSISAQAPNLAGYGGVTSRACQTGGIKAKNLEDHQHELLKRYCYSYWLQFESHSRETSVEEWRRRANQGPFRIRAAVTLD